jgi:sarcosine oxidase subunit gamma
MAETRRSGPLDGRRLAFGHVALEPAPPADRFVLRMAGEFREKIAAALGFPLPDKPKTSVVKGGIAAMWLGPDEWLVVGEAPAGLPARMAALGEEECSAVDISHRNCAILVSGSGAEDVIAGGCPQDVSLSVFAPGTCARTVLGKSEIVLFRTAADGFRVECWRSYSDYVWRFLADAARANFIPAMRS